MIDRARSGVRADGMPAGAWARFRFEFCDFLSFVRRPGLARRLPRPATSAWRAEWLSGAMPVRLGCWVLAMWAVNLLVLAPLALGAAQMTGSHHISILQISGLWFRAVIWAPIIEELLFRFGLRQPAAALWLAPILVLGVATVRNPLDAVLIVLALAVVGGTLVALKYRWPWARLRRYREIFPIFFHVATLAFAFLHLANFKLGGAEVWLLPLLVLPQWTTGLVLGWLRVRFGIGASMTLHALFNGGPITLIWLLLHYAPGMLDG